jgi:hypothetical protein
MLDLFCMQGMRMNHSDRCIMDEQQSLLEKVVLSLKHFDWTGF